MPKISCDNAGFLSGNLTKDPKVFDNSDGSNTIMLSIAVNRPYKNDKGERLADFVDCTAYIAPSVSGLGPYAYLSKGDAVGVAYTVRSSNYIDKQGERVFKQELRVCDLSFHGSKKKTA